ncbi:MAG: hypothetical protein HY722_14060 [Planctomycetes bacterium]|nr:hypothetical protein [Planctomycetota bacterium]
MTTRRTWWAAYVLVAVAAVGSVARAQGDPIADRYGETLDLTKDPALAERLRGDGLVKPGQTTVTVNDAFLADYVAVRRFRELPRFKPGDRVFVETSGELHYRAEVASVRPDGTYEVRVWDKLKSLRRPGSDNADIDRATGEITSTEPTLVEVVDPATGQKRQVEMLKPWLERPNTRTVTLRHDELARLNDAADRPSGKDYDLNGYRVELSRDPATGRITDAILAERVDAGLKVAEAMAGRGELDLRLPEDPKARDAAVERLSQAQRKLIMEVWSQNPMSYLRGDWANDQWSRMNQDPEVHRNGRLLVSGVLKYKVGVCSDQTAAITSVMREVGRRAGFDVRAVSGMTHDGGGHAFLIVRLANGKQFLMDPSWHAVTNHTRWAAMEPIDFATYDSRWWSNRHLNRFDEPVAPGRFVAAGTPEARARERGYSERFLEALVASKVRLALGDQLSTADAATLQKAADQAVREVLDGPAGGGARGRGRDVALRLAFDGDRAELARRSVDLARAPVALNSGPDALRGFRRATQPGIVEALRRRVATATDAFGPPPADPGEARTVREAREEARRRAERARREAVDRARRVGGRR